MIERIKTVADLLDALERGKIGYAAAMEWLGIDTFMDLMEIAHINGRPATSRARSRRKP